MKKEKIEKIEKVVKDLGMYDQKMFTYEELTRIAKRSGQRMIEVMEYLRYWR